MTTRATWLVGITLGVAVTMSSASRAFGANPGAVCLMGLHSAAAAYAGCIEKTLAKLYGGALDYAKLDAALSKCRTRYAAAWPKLAAKVAGSGTTCDGPRFVDRGLTVVDQLTGLEWEKKTLDADAHDVTGTYTLSGAHLGDGSAYTGFLAALNGGACFADACDWRLPTLTELEAIVLEAHPCTTTPCIDGVFGPTGAFQYWTMSVFGDERFAWLVHFGDGSTGVNFRQQVARVRAVRSAR
jgi:hypothetical protein